MKSPLANDQPKRSAVSGTKKSRSSFAKLCARTEESPIDAADEDFAATTQRARARSTTTVVMRGASLRFERRVEQGISIPLYAQGEAVRDHCPAPLRSWGAPVERDLASRYRFRGAVSRCCFEVPAAFLLLSFCFEVPTALLRLRLSPFHVRRRQD